MAPPAEIPQHFPQFHPQSDEGDEDDEDDDDDSEGIVVIAYYFYFYFVNFICRRRIV